jgi:hypothetical protein
MPSLRQRLSDQRARLGLFASWWMQELREAGEAILARLVPRWVTRTLVLLEPEGASVWTVRGGRRERVGSFSLEPSGAWPEELATPEVVSALRGTKAVFGFSPRYVLAHALSLPASIERELDQVVALQLERDCPMPLDRVYVDPRAGKRVRAGTKLDVTVLIIQRERVDRARERARTWGLRLARVGMIYDSGEIVGDFLRAPAAPGRLSFTRTDRRLAIAAVTLALSGAAIIAFQWGYERVMVGRKLLALQEPAAAAQKLARQLKKDAEPAEALVSLMRQPDALDVLTQLTLDTPKDTWFYDLDISAQWPQAPRIKLSGFTPVATILIGALQTSGNLKEVRLVSASSAGLGSGQDRLQMTAQFAPAIKTAPVDNRQPAATSVTTATTTPAAPALAGGQPR